MDRKTFRILMLERVGKVIAPLTFNTRCQNSPLLKEMASFIYCVVFIKFVYHFVPTDFHNNHTAMMFLWCL